METESHDQTLDFIFVTDIHYSLSNISLLKNWLSENSTKSFQNLQGIIACGDLVNADPGVSCFKTDENEFLEVLIALRELHEKIWFIPGNHDPASLFMDIPNDAASDILFKINALAINFHCKRIEIAPRLVLAGLGGSVDSTLFDEPEKVYWKGFPYTEEQIEKRLDMLMYPMSCCKAEIEDDNGHTNSVLLVTHSGPAYTSTTDIFYGEVPEKKHIQSGSVKIASSLNSFSAKECAVHPHPILAHIHGHTHSGLGLSSQIEKHPTINPGALKNGRFLHASFQSQENRVTPWKLKSVSFISL